LGHIQLEFLQWLTEANAEPCHLKTQHDGLFLCVVTVHPCLWLSFRDFPNDHDPRHLHVFGHVAEAKIKLEGASGVTLDWSVGLDSGDLRKVILEARRERTRDLENFHER
jgi:hypothetical protein